MRENCDGIVRFCPVLCFLCESDLPIIELPVGDRLSSNTCSRERASDEINRKTRHAFSIPGEHRRCPDDAFTPGSAYQHFASHVAGDHTALDYCSAQAFAYTVRRATGSDFCGIA